MSIILILKAALAMVTSLPRWGWALILVALLCGGFELHGRSVVQTKWDATDEARAELVREAKKGLQQVVMKTEVVETIRLQNIYIKGKEIEKQVPVFINVADDRHFGVNVGFVRVFNAAWSGETAGSAAESDREPAGIPLSEVADADAHNATSCLAWREIAIGLRQHYRDLQISIPEN